jgi:hypothetical protein
VHPRKDGRRGHHNELNACDGHARPFGLFLGLLQHDDVLGNAIGLGVVAVHVSPESEHDNGVEPPAVGVEKGHQVDSEYLCIEGIRVLVVGVPSLIHRGKEELGCAALGHFVAGVIVESGAVGCFLTDSDNGQRIVGNVFVVEQQAAWSNKCLAAMVGSVLPWFHEDCREGVNPPELIVGDFHQNWEEGFPNCGEVVVRGLSFKGGEGPLRLPEEERDCFGRHDLDGFLWDQAGSVDNCHNDNEGEGVGSSKLVGFGAFRDTAEPVRSYDGHGGLCGFFGVKFELDFHCRAAMGSTEDNNSKY